MATITANDYREEELVDAAAIVDGKVYQLHLVNRCVNSDVVRRALENGVEAATYYASGPRRDLTYTLRRRLTGEYVVERASRNRYATGWA